MLVCLLIELKNAVASGGRMLTHIRSLRLWHSVHGKKQWARGTFRRRPADVRFTPKSGHVQCTEMSALCQSGHSRARLGLSA